MSKLLNEARKDNIISNIQAIRHIISTIDDMEAQTKNEIYFKLDEILKILEIK